MRDTLDDVQNSLIRHLENCIRLSNETIPLLSSYDKRTGDVCEADLKQKIDDVKNLQIRMTTLAPMKTGKSTILNAIIGDEILPIHDEAMTALPTEIALQYSTEQHVVKEPCLLLTEPCQDILKEIQECVCTKLKCTGVYSLDKNLNFNSHLIATAQKIYNSCHVTDLPAEKTTGTENINELLRYINGLVHIFTFLYSSNTDDSDKHSPNKLLLKLSQNLPRVQITKTVAETCSHAATLPIGTRLYRLLLVDTPGPNEGTTSHRLKEIIKEAIKKADIVLVALDYTALGTEADLMIDETVREVRDIKDPSYVYAVVNKVDQRQENGKSAEDVRRHIAAKYEIREENVFELKARYGLVANKFLDMCKTSRTDEELLRTRQSTAARDVLRQCYPMDFEDKMQTVNSDELRKLAERLHKTSGIPEFLTSAIARIREEIIRRCIESAFRIGYKTYDDLQRDLELRRQNLNYTLEELQVELENLRKDQQTVHEINTNFDDATETASILSTLEDELQPIFTKARGMISDDMKALFGEKNKRWLDPTKWRPYFYKKRPLAAVACGGGAVTGGLLALVSTFTGIGIVIGGVVVIGVYYHSSGIMEFEKYDDAKKFIDYVIEEVNKISTKSYQIVTTEVNAACNNAVQSIQQACSRQINKIIARVRQRFDSNIEFPQCDIQACDVNLQHITSNSIPVNCRYRPLFGLVPFTLSCERDTKEHTRFHISRPELYNECDKLTAGNMTMIKAAVSQEVYGTMRKTVSDRVNVFHRSLHKYEKHINDYISDKNHNKEDVEKLKPQLDSLKIKLDAEKNKLDECCTKFKKTIS